jgi:hypothetical protein
MPPSGWRTLEEHEVVRSGDMYWACCKLGSTEGVVPDVYEWKPVEDRFIGIPAGNKVQWFIRLKKYRSIDDPWEESC